MSKSNSTHVERTAAEPRQSGLHPVRLCRIQRVASSIRLLTLALPYAIKFLPGQWVDLHIPSLPSAGGFTITSPPSWALKRGPDSAAPPTVYSGHSRLFSSHAASTFPITSPAAPSSPIIELAVQRTSNPPAQWLWQPEPSILDAELQIRVGGSFTWPPKGWDLAARPISRAVFVAGGVGINPFMSMLSAMYESETGLPEAVEVLYSSKASNNLRDVLFLERIAGLMESRPGPKRHVRVHLTGLDDKARQSLEGVMRGLRSDWFKVREGRISGVELEEALGGVEERRKGPIVVYVCGPGPMVDDVVKRTVQVEGVSEDRVFCEKWW